MPSGQLGKQARAHCDGGADSQQAGGRGVSHIPLHFVKQADNASSVGQQLPALLGDAQFFGKPIKQADAVFRLDFGHSLADGGLGDIQAFGRQAHFARLGYGDENAQMTDGRGNQLLFAYFIHRLFPMILILYYYFTGGAARGIMDISQKKRP